MHRIGELRKAADMRGSWWMTKPPEVGADLADLGRSTAACECPLMPMSEHRGEPLCRPVYLLIFKA